MYKWNIITYILCALVMFAYGRDKGPLGIMMGLACWGTALWYMVKSVKETKKEK